MKRLLAATVLTAVLFGNALPALAETPPVPAPPPATAETTAEAVLPEATVTPDSYFYGLKLFVEKLRILITRDAAERAELLTEQAKTRLAEANQMMEAGKSDLAATALAESQQKFQQAQTVLSTAVEAGKQLDSLQSRLTASEAQVKTTLAKIIVVAPAEAKPQVEAAVTDVMIQFAATQDGVSPDAALAEAAQKLAEAAQAAAEQKAALQTLPPRVVVVLDAMAKESGRPLTDVMALYEQLKGISAVADKLKVKLEIVQAAAKIEIEIEGDEAKIEIKEANGTKTEIKIEDGKTEVKVEQPKSKESVEGKKEKEKEKEKGCKEHPVFKVHPGKGKGKDKKCKDSDGDDDDDDEDEDDD